MIAKIENKQRCDAVAKPELGTKRTCPTTGRKFYDMNKDPIISPYTGQSFPRSMFEPQPKALKPEPEEDEVDAENPNVELVPLDEADAADAEKDVEVVTDDIEVEDDGEGEDDTFLEEEEEGDDDVSVLIDGDIETDEET